MDRRTQALARAAGATFLMTLAAAAWAQEPETVAGFTAQGPPQVAVLEFDSTNAEAAKAGLPERVEALLVTALQNQSQLAVVERGRLGGLHEEKRRIQMGIVDPPLGPEARKAALELPKRADVFILVTVALLGDSRVEIDARLFTGFDGQVAAAVRRDGPKDCLRSVVGRLGAALEQEILRLYNSNGSLEIRLKAPENVRLFLTPVPLEAAAREAPAESSSVKIGDEYDTVEPWITNPTSYTIDNLLPGWYSLRLARPGYEDLKTGPRRWEVRRRAGQLDVYDRTTDLPLSDTDPDSRRFVVRVEAGSTKRIDGDALGFVFRKKAGSIAPRVKRQYLDKDYSRKPQRVVLMGGHELEINRFQKPAETNQECALLRELPPPRIDYGRTYIPEGQEFDFATFHRGELVIDDYQGETVPAGQYEMVLWDPHFEKSKKIKVTVRDGDEQKEARADLARETRPLKLETTGERPGHRMFLKGRETRYFRGVPLDTKELRGVPADTYRVSTDIPGLDDWTRTFEHLPGKPVAPRYYTSSPAYSLETTSTYEDGTARSGILIVKTGFVLAGRLDLFHRTPTSPAGDLFIDEEVGKLLDRLLVTRSGPPGELRNLLSQRLEVVDLLVLSPRDMASLRETPEGAAVVQDYVKKGGSLFAFVSGVGDFGGVVGEPLGIRSLSKPTARFDLTPGQVAGLIPRFDRKVDLPVKRPLPEVGRLAASWLVIASTEVLETPRILERGEKDAGGYVALWLDDPAAFRDQRGRTVPKVQETRAKVEDRVLKWARYLMYRRYDKTGKLRRQAEVGLGW